MLTNNKSKIDAVRPNEIFWYVRCILIVPRQWCHCTWHHSHNDVIIFSLPHKGSSSGAKMYPLSPRFHLSSSFILGLLNGMIDNMPKASVSTISNNYLRARGLKLYNVWPGPTLVKTVNQQSVVKLSLSFKNAHMPLAVTPNLEVKTQKQIFSDASGSQIIKGCRKSLSISCTKYFFFKTKQLGG